jgi:hypothetical protein
MTSGSAHKQVCRYTQAWGNGVDPPADMNSHTPFAQHRLRGQHGRRQGRAMTATCGASGSVNRSSSPGSVRYMSVASVVQRRLLTGDDRG